MKNFEDFLLQELERTGFPLQVEIASALEDTYLVENNAYYYDVDEHKAREIDIDALARKSYGKRETTPFSIVEKLAIECKKSDARAWVFFTQPEKLKWFQGQLCDFMQIIMKNLWINSIDLIQDETGFRSHYARFSRVASSYVEINYKKGGLSGKDEIFEAKNQLMKFLSYDISQLLDRLKNRRHFDPKKNCLIYFYHPVVVFEGKLYEAICEKGSISLKEKKHLLLSTTGSPSYLKNFPESDPPDLPYLIDIVRKDYFGDFMQILENEYSSLYDCICANVGKLKTAITEFTPTKKHN